MINTTVLRKLASLACRFTRRQNVPNLQHLNLRYLRRLTDSSLYAIARKAKVIYSLDLSFCTKVSAEAVGSLLFSLPGLSELRLLSCTQLRPEGVAQFWTIPLTSESSCLSVLDLRSCVDEGSVGFITSQTSRPFNEFLPNFFTRDARWGEEGGKHRKLFDKVLSAPLDGSTLISVASLGKIRSGSFGSYGQFGWGNATMEPRFKTAAEPTPKGEDDGSDTVGKDENNDNDLFF